MYDSLTVSCAACGVVEHDSACAAAAQTANKSIPANCPTDSPLPRAGQTCGQMTASGSAPAFIRCHLQWQQTLPLHARARCYAPETPDRASPRVFVEVQLQCVVGEPARLLQRIGVRRKMAVETQRLVPRRVSSSWPRHARRHEWACQHEPGSTVALGLSR